MAKKMLINALHPEEARIAIVEDGLLVDLDIEIAGHEQTRGNIYKGVVVRVEPGLQAAFVDIGLKKLGFLQMGEIHPSQWQWRDDVPEEQRNRRPRIQEVLRRGQELVVQVEKGERDMKGAALTGYVSLPGRYMVLMPGDSAAGISRKVENEAERKKLKESISKLEIPDGYGYIVRTEAVGKTKTDLTKDLTYLIKLYESVMEKAEKTKSPALIYQESSMVLRTIRDYFTAEVDEVLVDSKEVYKDARAFFKQTMPKFEKLVKIHQEKRPIFSKYQLEEQIDLIHEKKVPLKSGGSIVIEPTEALVSIDVNSGKSTGEKGVEDTAFKTNIEAAQEAARQLRLRDLGGLIVIDFIDMRDKKHINEVEKTLKNALKADKARVTVGKISQFGILEMSRQRIRQTLNEATYLGCPHCEGRGKLKSVEAMAVSFLRKVHGAAAKGTVSEVRGALPLEVAYYLLNRKKRDLAQIEDDYDIAVTVKGKPSFLMNQLEVELVRREKPIEPLHEVVAEEKAEEPAPDEEIIEAKAEAVTEGPAEAGEAGNGKKKRKRRRGKKKTRPEDETAETQETEEAPEAEESAEEEAVEPEGTEVVEGEALEEGAEPGEEGEGAPAGEGKKKRKRRRGKKKPHPEEAVATEVALAAEEAGTPAEEEAAEEGFVEEEGEEGAEAPETEGETAAAGEGKKKRRRRRRRGKKPLEETQLQQEASPETGGLEETGAALPSAESPVREIVADTETAAAENSGQAQDVTATTETPVAAAEKPKRKAAPRRKKKEEGAPVAAEAPQAAAAETAPAEALQPTQEPEAEPTSKPAKPVRKPQPSRKKKPVEKETAVPEPTPVAETPKSVEEKPKKPRRPAKKKPTPQE